MPQPPSGTVTFLFSDIEGSTKLWDSVPDAMRSALERHDELVRTAIETHGGYVVKTTGDGVHAAFGRAGDALLAAVAMQESLAGESWPEDATIRVRIGVHTGEVAERDGDYFGTAVNRAARLMAVAHGGQSVCSHSTAALAGDAVLLQSMGEHRLRDLAAAEQVFQVGEGVFPPLRSLDAYPTNLPLQVSSFFGRDEDVQAITKALDEARLVTITGVGGVGKTRLALQVAAELLPGYEDGAWLCELAAAQDPDELEGVVSAALGAPLRSGSSLGESIVEFLRMKRLLLVLDNCEHLLDAAAELAERCLAGSPGLRILATSREGLAIAGEQVRPLRSLPTPDAAAAIDAISASDSVGLFVERARGARPDFAVDATNAEAVGEICRRVDGIPLAIELAAARVASMGPAEIAKRLDERFRLLTGSRRRTVERHQTLRSTLEWSYSLLAERERTVFDRLGVFAGSFDARAAEAVAVAPGIEGWDVLDALGELVAKSMLVAEPVDDGTVRYSLLETLRHYALDQLAEHSDVDDVRQLHGEHYARLAEELGAMLIGPEENAGRIRIFAEVDNLRAAVGFGLDAADAARRELALRIIAALAHELTFDRVIGVGEWAIRALDVVDDADPRLRSAVRAVAGYRVHEQNHAEEATRLGREALADEPPLNDPAFVLIHSFRASIIANTGDFDRATASLRESLALVGSPENAPYAAAVFHTQIAVYLGLFAGDADRARAEADSALRIARGLRSPITQALALFALASALSDSDPAGSLAAAEESIALSGVNALIYNSALFQICVQRMSLGDGRGAIAPLRATIANLDAQGDFPALGGSLSLAIVVFERCGREESAVTTAAILGDGAISSYPLLVHQRFAEEYGAALERISHRLGGEADAAASARGSAMTYHEAIDYVLAELDAAAGSA
jgi:predicted ATPase/class 3 adenylate cyclase